MILTRMNCPDPELSCSGGPVLSPVLAQIRLLTLSLRPLPVTDLTTVLTLLEDWALVPFDCVPFQLWEIKPARC